MYQALSPPLKGPGDEASNAYTTDITKLIYARVSNRKRISMQNKFVSVLSSRSTLGKIETTLQIGYTLGKVREKAIILNHKPKYKKKNGYVTKTMCIEAGAQAGHLLKDLT